ncbi:MAG TPA: GntG family PLP-dependent aldolase [Rhodothermales bacterium]
MIDLRSDTVTRPTEAMRRAMFEAEVGDDVFGEDPTVNRLQERVADVLGKEAALFVPSGVMGNQLGLKLLTSPGDEVLLERTSHILNHESGAPGLLSGIQTNVLDGDRGVLPPDAIRAAVRPPNYWQARTRLLCLENTLNQAGGRIYPLEALRANAVAAREKGLRLHLDGARLWNASVATGIAESVYAEPFDTVNVCLSKGLGAPVGSVLAGSRDLITEARRYRKLFGGGMRQIGFLAAAGLYAIEHHRERLAEDHANAKRLAEGLAECPVFRLDPAAVETNIVMFDVAGEPVATVLGKLREEGVLMVPFGPSTIRATTHLDVGSGDVDRVLATVRRLFG